MLDYTVDEEVTGKPSGQDLREHKMTLPLIRALDDMTDADRARVSAFFADPDPQDEAIADIGAISQPAYTALPSAGGRAASLRS
mgnify:CR=1 FL=1